MKKNMITALALLAATAGFSQQQQPASHITVNWNLGTPLSKDFVKGLSGYGANIGYNQPIGKDLAAGVEIGWNTNYTYYPRQTNPTKNGAITTDMYKSLFTVPLTVNLMKYFAAGKLLSPYAKLGMGALYSEQHIYYNIYGEDHSNWGFTFIPEIGLHVKTSAANRWAFNIGAQYRYATNSVKDYNINSLQSVNFNGGISWSLH